MAGKALTKHERLGRLATLLHAERNPYYVIHPLPAQLRGDFPCEGWYWIPPSAAHAELLARDSYDAYHELVKRVEALDVDIVA